MIINLLMVIGMDACGHYEPLPAQQLYLADGSKGLFNVPKKALRPDHFAKFSNAAGRDMKTEHVKLDTLI